MEGGTTNRAEVKEEEEKEEWLCAVVKSLGGRCLNYFLSCCNRATSNNGHTDNEGRQGRTRLGLVGGGCLCLPTIIAGAATSILSVPLPLCLSLSLPPVSPFLSLSHTESVAIRHVCECERRRATQ